MEVNRDAYARAFEQLRDRLPGASLDGRSQALARFLEQGFPTRELEDWKYTDLSDLARQQFALAAPAEPTRAPEALGGAILRHYVNGRERIAENTAVAALPFTGPLHDPSIDALNAAFAVDGLRLDVAPSDAGRLRLQVMTEVSAGSMAHLRHRIRVAANARASVFFEHVSDAASFTTQVFEVELGANSQLDFYRLQAESPESTHLSRFDAQVGADAQLRFYQVDVGAALARHDVNLQLAAAGARVELRGVYASFGRSHHDTHTRIEHAAPHGTSRETFRGVVGDRAHAVFNGLIRVAPGAHKTDSEQQVANLLLSRRAEVNAKPELQIFNDDVRCIHGATTGALDTAAEFYLRSRGLDAVSARTLLTLAFAREPLLSIEWERLRERLEAVVEAQLRETFLRGEAT